MYGKCYYVLALALFQFIECGMLLLIILKCKVEGFLAYVLLDLTLVMLFLPVIYFLLYWKNKKIVMSKMRLHTIRYLVKLEHIHGMM